MQKFQIFGGSLDPRLFMDLENLLKSPVSFAP